METNDYRNNSGSSEQPYTYHYGADQQQGGYYYNPYNQYGASPGGKPPEKKGLKRALVAIFMVVCLIAGSAIGVYLISPGLGGHNNSNVAMSAPTATRQSTAAQSDVQPSSALTTDDPQLGGEAPDISASDSPVVQIAEAVSPSVVVVRIDDPSRPDEYDPQGTGFIISSDGYIATNNHVVKDRGSYDVIVKTSDGAEYKAGVVGGDAASDLAVIKIDGKGLQAAALGNSDTLKVGEDVVAIGNALGNGFGAVTTGIISGLHHEVQNEDGYSQEYIQTDAAINPGNSGGPLINMAGEVIGINTLKDINGGVDQYGQTIPAEGIGYAIPINSAVPILEQLETAGSVERPGIGVKVQEVEENGYTDNSPAGLLVAYLAAGGPAELAGIQEYDIITGADGEAIATVADLRAAINSHAIGEDMSLSVWREGNVHQVSVTIGDTSKMNW